MVSRLNRRQFLAAGGGALGAVASGVLLRDHVWPLLDQEDLIPGTPPDIKLSPRAWTTTADRLRFAAIGDNGSGGRQAMAVATRLAETYQQTPFGLVAHLGDISYYGNLEERYVEVFERPMAPLIDAGVGFELAIGNHDTALRHSDESLEAIEAELRLLGTPSRYYSNTHGPAELLLPRFERARRVRTRVEDAVGVARRQPCQLDEPVEDRRVAPPAVLLG